MFSLLSQELHKPVKRKFRRRKVIVNNIDEVWSADLIEMQEFSNKNDGFRYMLNIIDVLSKYAWSIPLKNKKAETVLEGIKNVIQESGRSPEKIYVDQGGEFYNKIMDQWLKNNNIIRYSTYGEHKSCIVERFNRTLKTNMWKRFTSDNTRRWIDMLPELMKNYNNKVHTSIKMKPIDASKIKN